MPKKGQPWPCMLHQESFELKSDLDKHCRCTHSGSDVHPAIDWEAVEDAKSKRKINEQIWAALVCFLLTGITLFFLIRTKGRVMKVDDEGFYPPGGGLIPFADITKLDKRKWETKGLATLTYKSGEEEKKAKIDGMVYGQFKEEEGAPAEALFQKVLANFEGELIELVDEDEEEEDETVKKEEADVDAPEENADS